MKGSDKECDADRKKEESLDDAQGQAPDRRRTAGNSECEHAGADEKSDKISDSPESRSLIMEGEPSIRMPKQCPMPPFSGSRELRAHLARREDLGLTRAEFSVLARLSTPAKIQGFIDALPSNFEIGGQTCLPVREVLRPAPGSLHRGAMLAACALWVHGEPPLLMDLRASATTTTCGAVPARDLLGCDSKTIRRASLARSGVPKLRELAMSTARVREQSRPETLRSYSRPFDLRGFDRRYGHRPKNCWEVGEAVDEIRHYRLVTKRQARVLRLRDTMERKAGAPARAPAAAKTVRPAVQPISRARRTLRSAKCA